MDASGGASRLLTALTAVAIPAADAKALVAAYRQTSERDHPHETARDREYRIAKAIVRRYARLAALAGGAAALPGIVPGIGTVLALIGGGAIDAGASLKFQVDMCRCLAECFGHDLTREDADRLSMLLALVGVLEGAGEPGALKLGTKAGVAVIRRTLQGAALQVANRLLIAIGIRFSRKTLERAIPLGVGVSLGAGMNYGLTRFVGTRAIAWFSFERAGSAEPART